MSIKQAAKPKSKVADKKKVKTVAKASKKAAPKTIKRTKKAELRDVIVNFILDQSGSMATCKESVVSGFNEYIDSLKNKPEHILLSLTKFDTEFDVAYTAAELADVKHLSLEDGSYRPSGCTALYDAIGHTVAAIEAHIAKKKGAKPAVLCVIMTDGEENSSKEWTKSRITALIKEKGATGDYTFVYLGADQDAWRAAGGIGIGAGNTLSYSSVQTSETFNKLANSTAVYTVSSSVSPIGSSTVSDFFDKDIKDSAKAKKRSAK